MEWIDLLEEEVRKGLTLSLYRQKRGYNLFWTGKGMHADGMFEVRQGMTGYGGDIRQFEFFEEAYDWLWNGIPIKSKKT